MVNVQDVTGSRMAEEDVRFLAAMVESSGDAIVGTNADGVIVSWNAGAERIFGYARDEMLGQSLTRLAPADRQTEMLSLLAKVGDGQRIHRLATIRVRKDGVRIPISITVAPVRTDAGRVIGLSFIGRDMTAPDPAVEDLCRTAEEFEQIFALVHVPLAYLDRDFNFIRVNRAYADMDAHTPESYVGKNLFALHPDAHTEAIFRRVAGTGEAYFALETSWVCSTRPGLGADYWDWSLYPVKNQAGDVRSLVFMAIDVTDKVMTKRRLQAATAYARNLIEASPDPIVAIGTDGKVADANATAEQVLGYLRTESIGTPFTACCLEPQRCLEGYERVINEGLLRDYPLDLRRRDGGTIPALVNGAVYRRPDGAIAGILVTLRDITEAKRAAEELARRERAFRRLAENSPDLIARMDKDLRYLYVSPTVAEASGIPAETFIGKTNQELGLPEEAVCVWDENDRAVFASGQPRQLEVSFAGAHGTLNYDWRVVPEFGAAGRVESILCIGHDITERKRAEERLRQSETRYRSLFEQMLDGYALFEAMLDDQHRPYDYRFVEVNRAFERYARLRREAIAGKTLREVFIHEEDLWLDVYENVLRTGQGQRFARYSVTFDRYLEVAAYRPTDGLVAVLLTDVTQRQQAEAELHRLTQELQEKVVELRRRAAQMQRAEELSRLGYWRNDLRTAHLTWSDGSFRLLGLEPGSLVPTVDDFTRRVRPDDLPVIRHAMAAAQGRESTYEVEFRISRADTGEERTLHARGEVEYDASGEPIALFGATQDVTEFKRAEWMLRERFRVMAENIPEVFWVSTPGNTAMLYVNPAYERIWGRSRESLYEDPRSFLQAIHPNDRDRIAASRAGRGEGEWEVEYRIVGPDGAVRWIHDRGFPLRDERNQWNLIVGIASDITELKQTETALEEALDDLRKANRRLEALSYVDPLTGIANRRSMQRFIDREWPRVRRHGGAFSMIMVDIDFFKLYNDRYGHARGDECLREVAKELAEHVRRPSDITVRLGGEEFGVFLPETGSAGALKLAEEIRQAVADLHIPHAHSAAAPFVTVSLGVATVDTVSANPAALQRLADRALYEAKGAGRNRVAAAPGPV